MSGIFIISSLYFYSNWDNLNFNIKIIGFLLWFCQNFFFLISSVINPGTPNIEYYLENYDLNKTKVKNFRICSKCKLVMDLNQGTEHCNECDICIMKINHHCSLISKCIGIGNLYYFYCFIASSIFYILFFVYCFFFI